MLTPSETVLAERLCADIDRARADMDAARPMVARSRELQADELAVAAAQRQSFPSGQPRSAGPYDHAARIGAEARTYNRGNDPIGLGFVHDVLRAQVRGDPAAWERLSRHQAEERVERPLLQQQQRVAGDSVSSNWAGLVVPQYLVDMAAPAVTARRPFADNVATRHPLPPEGLTFDISRVTTGTSVTLQANELDTVSATSADDTLLPVAVQTAAGQQKLSRQVVDRGSGVDQMILNDLMAHAAATLDATLITQATTGLSAVAVATTYDDTQPTAAKLYPKILSAQAASEAATLGPPVSHMVCHSRRWAWLSSQMTSTWPLVNTAGLPPQSGGQSDPNASYATGVRGKLPNGMLVVVDNNIATNLGVGTNQDEIYVVPSSECHLWEDDVQFIRADQPAAPNLGVLLVVWSYFGYTFSRYSSAMSKVAGTSLVTPVF